MTTKIKTKRKQGAFYVIRIQEKVMFVKILKAFFDDRFRSNASVAGTMWERWQMVRTNQTLKPFTSLRGIFNPERDGKNFESSMYRDDTM